MKSITASSIQSLVNFYSAACVLQFSIIAYTLDKLRRNELIAKKSYSIPLVILFILNVASMVSAMILLHEVYIQSAQRHPDFVSAIIQTCVDINYYLFIISVFMLVLYMLIVIWKGALLRKTLCALICFCFILFSNSTAYAQARHKKTDKNQKRIAFVGSVPAEVREAYGQSSQVEYVFDIEPSSINIKFEPVERRDAAVKVYNGPNKSWLHLGVIKKGSFRNKALLQNSLDTLIQRGEVLSVCRKPLQVIITFSESTPAATVYFDSSNLGDIDKNGNLEEDTNGCKGKTSELKLEKPKCESYVEQILVKKHSQEIKRSKMLNCD